MYKVKRFISKIIKICKYLPVLWRDEDWDYEYILDLLAVKLRRTKDCIHRNAIIVPEEARDVCIQVNQALDHIHNYKNCHEVYDELYEPLPFEIGHVFVPTGHGTSQMLTINKNSNRRLTEEEEKLHTKKILDLCEFERKEWEAIWDTIKEYGQGWWD